MEVVPTGSNERPIHVAQHAAELIKFRDERKALVFHLTNGEQLEAAVRWFDDQAIHVVTAGREEITLFKHAIISYRAA
jgi:sRNA-binding regulator protein Hfq